MSIVSVVLILLIFAAGFYLISKYVPENTLRLFLLIGLAIILFVWILSITGVWTGLARAHT